MSLRSQIEEGVREGMRLAFENNAFNHCDGSDDPEDRCPSEGVCVCSYVHWRNLPWWRRLFTKQPTRPSLEASQGMVFSRMTEGEAPPGQAPKPIPGEIIVTQAPNYYREMMPDGRGYRLARLAKYLRNTCLDHILSPLERSWQFWIFQGYIFERT